MVNARRLALMPPERRRCAAALMVVAFVSPFTASAPQASEAPPWRTRLVWWETHASQERPWRADSRLAPFGEPGFPDDFQVRFAQPDSMGGGAYEVMWVRVIAAHSVTGLFLGILLNQPHYVPSVVEGDNVVFRRGTGVEPPTAVGAPDYGEAGWPADSRAPDFVAVLRDGIRAYRAGRDGHHMPGIERCIEVLAPAIAVAPTAASADERFVGHFVLGRCMAEKYETERALEQFRAAIALDPSDLDAHMALLAELSLMVHQLPGELPADAEARWEHAFLEQLRLVRARFTDDDDVAKMLAMIFDPAHEANVAPVWKLHVEKLRRVGYGVFRWKRR